MKQMTSEEFYSALSANEYGQKYLELIDKAKSENRKPRVRGDGFEKHHIHPRALGGCLQCPDNLIKLSSFEHCKAHVLLARAVPCWETLGPVTFLGNTVSSLSAQEIDELEAIWSWSEIRKQSREEQSKRMKGKEVPWKGRPMTKEHAQKIWETKRINGTDVPWNKGVSPSAETREKLRQANLGKKQSEETKRKRSETLSRIGHKPPSAKGTIKVFFEGVARRILPVEKEYYLQRGFFATRRESLEAFRNTDCVPDYIKERIERFDRRVERFSNRTPEDRKRVSEYLTGRIYLYSKDLHRKRILPSEKEHYLATGNYFSTKKEALAFSQK